MVEIVANLHMHTPYSDGAKFHREIAADAARAGLDAIIVTDHNVWVNGIDGYHSGVLVLTGEEVHDVRRLPQCNHCLIYNAGDEMSVFAGNPQMLIDETNKRGGLAFFAHPFERASPLSDDYMAIPWQDWQVRNNAGIEIWNTMTEFKARLWSWPAAALYAFLPSLVIFGPFAQTLKKWDALLAEGRRVVAIGNSDAHGAVFQLGPIRRTVLPYEYLFGCVNTHLLIDRPLSSDVARDKAMIFDALRNGRCFVGYDRAGDTRGFSFNAKSGAVRATMGEELRRAGAVTFSIQLPARGRIRLLRNGETFAAANGKALELTTVEPGVYRVEVKRVFRGWLRGWIYSNPIYVR